MDGKLPELFVDKRRLTQVLANLLENSLRHTPKGGSVAVEAVTEGAGEDGSVRFVVRDSGEGIEPSEIKKIFESFYQPASPGSQRGRLGLGLSISQEIVESHGGRIWVESEGRGKGAAFFFTIPVRKPAAEKKPAPGRK